VGIIQTFFAKPSVFAITILKGNTRVEHEVKTTLGHLPEPRGADNSLWEMHFCKGGCVKLNTSSLRDRRMHQTGKVKCTVQYSTV